METRLLSLKFLQISLLLLLLLTSLCASCPSNVKHYPITVIAAQENFDPVHLKIETIEKRIEPGGSVSFRVSTSEDYDDYTVTVRLFRMDTLLHSSDVVLKEDVQNYILLREITYGNFSVTYSSD